MKAIWPQKWLCNRQSDLRQQVHHVITPSIRIRHIPKRAIHITCRHQQDTTTAAHQQQQHPTPTAASHPRSADPVSSTMAAAAAAAAPREHPYHPPVVCYAVENLPAVDKQLLQRLAEGKHELVQELTIPPRDGRAWEVQAGQLFRIVCTDGPQVADVNFWNLHNPRERFYSSKTRQMHASHLKAHDRLWSCFPYMRPLATITHETIQYGIDSDGASVHDVIGSRCDPYTNWLLTGENMNVCCHSNLTRAVAPFGLSEDDVHDVLNAFMCTGFTRSTNQYFTKPSPVRPGDYIEFLAETDLLVAASTCPQGDVSVACGTGKAPQCFPLGVQVFQPTPEMLQGWQPSEPVRYTGGHGMQ